MFFVSSLALISARFPNSVQKTFTVSGKTALEWAKVLGLDPKERQNLSFPLHPMEAHALSLSLNSPTETAAMNSLVFDPEKPTLILSGNWLDQLTGSGVSKKPRYTFGSGFIPADLTGSGPWGDLLRSLGFPRSNEAAKKNGEVLERRSSATHWFPWTEKLPWLEVKVYQVKSFEEAYKAHPWGYQAVIGVEE